MSIVSGNLNTETARSGTQRFFRSLAQCSRANTEAEVRKMQANVAPLSELIERLNAEPDLITKIELQPSHRTQPNKNKVFLLEIKSKDTASDPIKLIVYFSEKSSRIIVPNSSKEYELQTVAFVNSQYDWSIDREGKYRATQGNHYVPIASNAVKSSPILLDAEGNKIKSATNELQLRSLYPEIPNQVMEPKLIKKFENMLSSRIAFE